MGEIDWSLQIWTAITFGGLLILLARFVFKPLQEILNKRESSIRESLEKADLANSNAEKLLTENQETLNEARTEARKIINEGNKIVAQMQKEAELKAKNEANLIIQHARTEINKELQKGLDELKGTVANLSIRISRQIIQEDMDDKKHERLVDNFIERLKASHASRKPSN
ncbi:MAG: F0F1 ATP synthase subunit B [Kiritimatiellae bacterium]|nr:F0F1 ATP synthase subunit B [Kiritimatiellia bacterium]